MAIGWLRILDALTGVSEIARLLRGAGAKPGASGGLVPGSPMLGQVEARLANVVVAALKEAFDRDSARLELERAHLEAERRRAEELRRREALRHAADRRLAEARLVAGCALIAWVTSVAFVMMLTPHPTLWSRRVLTCGWACLLATIACSLADHVRTTAWLGRFDSTLDLPRSRASSLSLWLLILGFGLTGASLLMGLVIP